MNWALSRQVTLSILGVPHSQRREVVAQHRDGVAGFIRESMEYLAHNLLFRDNYFYTVYVRGSYSAQCCPEYLKPAQFLRLKTGLAARVVPHTCTVTEFLLACDEPISRFVLLDHMDWMSSYYPNSPGGRMVCHHGTRNTGRTGDFSQCTCPAALSRSHYAWCCAQAVT